MASGDSDAVFGGDGSVRWVIDVERARQHKTFGRAKKGGGHRQVGENETARGAHFTVTIRLPQKKRDLFLTGLRNAVKVPRGGKVTFKLPIEDRRTTRGSAVGDQIRISWKSGR